MRLNFRKPSNFHYNYVPDNLRGLRIQKSICGFSNLNGNGRIRSLEPHVNPASGPSWDQARFSI